MSGIVNSAGSRSGVIGTTELDYEEGTWTPSWSNQSSDHATYTKIGRVVTIHLKMTASGTSTNGMCSGLPFTPTSYSGGGCFVIGYDSNVGTDNSVFQMVRVDEGSDTIYINSANRNTVGTPSYASADYIVLGVTYECDNIAN